MRTDSHESSPPWLTRRGATSWPGSLSGTPRSASWPRRTTCRFKLCPSTSRCWKTQGLVSRSQDAQRRPRHLEAEVFDLMTAWIERYRRQAEERFRRLDAVLASMDDES